MCLYVQFWFVKNQTVVQIPHYNHVLHKKNTTLENYTKSVHSYHVTHTLLRHKYTSLPCHTYNQQKRTYRLIMSHTQNKKKEGRL